MERYALIAELKDLIGNYVRSRGLDLVDLTYRYEARNLILRILLDRPEGGITLDECALMNNEVSRILDERNIIAQRYILEVSSPGLDRPLLNKSDFSRCLHKKVKVFLKEPVNGKIEWDGLIKEVSDSVVFLDTGGLIIEIPFQKMNKAKQLADII